MPNSHFTGHTVFSYDSPLGNEFSISRQSFSPEGGKGSKRIAFVAGLHGDELEGVFLCFRLIKYLRKLQENFPQAITGSIHIYPTVNPQALGNVSRFWPFFETDLNRMFGGLTGSLPSHAAKKLMEDIREQADLVVDVHSSNLHLKEAPQIRIIEGFDKKLIPLAQWTNVDVIWVHPAIPVLEYTLGYGLNRSKIPTLVVEAGTCLKLDRAISDQLFDGSVNLLCKTGILNLKLDSIPKVRQARLVNPDHVTQITARKSGLFLAQSETGVEVAKGELLGELIDPTHGTLLEKIISPIDGFLFTLRELPMTYEGAVLARIAITNPPTT
tara:strand:+ start:2694 stop:3674 length:981 start_codon:yes stop_codon:yes gene_type:complete